MGQVSGGTILAIEGCNPDGHRARVSALDGTTAWCNITGVALNVSLRNYEVPEILTTPTPLPLTLELAEVQPRGPGSDHLAGQDIHLRRLPGVQTPTNATAPRVGASGPAAQPLGHSLRITPPLARNTPTLVQGLRLTAHLAYPHMGRL